MKIIVLLTLLTFISTSSGYKLIIYSGIDCNYCRFATNQIQQLVNQNHWENILQIQIIYCQIDSKLCRDSSVKPMLAIYSSQNVKLAQIGGVRSKIYFRDWIANIVNKNPVKTQIIDDNIEKYRKIVIKNRQEVKKFYHHQIQRQKKIKNDRLDILKQAQQFIKQRKGEDGISKDQNNQENSIRQFFRTIALISKYVLAVIAIIGGVVWIKDYYLKRSKQQRSPIPVSDYQQRTSIYSK